MHFGGAWGGWQPKKICVANEEGGRVNVLSSKSPGESISRGVETLGSRRSGLRSG